MVSRLPKEHKADLTSVLFIVTAQTINLRSRIARSRATRFFGLRCYADGGAKIEIKFMPPRIIPTTSP